LNNSISGRAWVFGDNMNTDVIHPPEYFSLDDERVRMGLFRGFDPTLQQRISPDDVIVGGRNFGCGSSRETVIRCLKLNHIGAILAVDFARIFFRSATNLGLPCLTFRDPQDSTRVCQGQRLDISLEEWIVRTDSGAVIDLEPVGPFIIKIWRNGGLLSLLGS